VSAFVFQLINASILFGFLFFVLKKMLDQHFKKERENLQEKMREAAEELEKARIEFEVMKEKCDRLEEEVLMARKEAEASLLVDSQRIQEDTDQFIQKLSADFQQKVKLEEEMAKEDLKEKILDEAFQLARASLASRMQKEDAAWTSAMIQNQSVSGKKNYAS
jgi:F0F1-type ATP synthase membrane subunit b/b'